MLQGELNLRLNRSAEVVLSMPRKPDARSEQLLENTVHAERKLSNNVLGRQRVIV